MDVNLCIGLLILVAFVMLGITHYEQLTNEVTYVKSSIDNNEYLVRNRDDKQAAADLIAKIRVKLEKLINSMKEKYPNDKSVNRMSKKFNADNISESGKNSQYTSYSVNKGEKISILCKTKR